MPSSLFTDCLCVNPFYRMIKGRDFHSLQRIEDPNPTYTGMVYLAMGADDSLILVLENISQSQGYCCIKPNMDLDFQITSNVTRTEDQTPPYSGYTFCKKTAQEHHISLRTSSDLKVYSHLSPGLEKKYSLKELIFRDVIFKCSCFTFIKQNISVRSFCM